MKITRIIFTVSDGGQKGGFRMEQAAAIEGGRGSGADRKSAQPVEDVWSGSAGFGCSDGD